jgi:hypothetical protein
MNKRLFPGNLYIIKNYIIYTLPLTSKYDKFSKIKHYLYQGSHFSLGSNEEFSRAGLRHYDPFFVDDVFFQKGRTVECVMMFFLATSCDDASTQFLLLCNIFRSLLLSATRDFAIFVFTTHGKLFS